mmetsp:Transcript_23831/g.50531  ORF Transcript_23831/g.50531 Transcript_23831/m.50531 type:complete len:160 (-) Transcript_23831:76-555(-)
MRRQLLATAGGAAGGLGAGAWLWCPRDAQRGAQVSPLCGTYELTSCEPSPAGNVSGLMVHQPNGHVSTQIVVKSEDLASYVGYSGKWFCHDPSFYPPHFGKPSVEHHIRASSLPKLVGKTLSQEYELSQDGCRLTTSNVSLSGGVARQVATLQWKRVLS